MCRVFNVIIVESHLMFQDFVIY